MSFHKRVARNIVPRLNDCTLEDRASTSVMTVGLFPSAPTQVVVPIGSGHVLIPVNTQDPSNYPAGDGHRLPGFETDPGLPPVDIDPTTPVTGLGSHSLTVG